MKLEEKGSYEEDDDKPQNPLIQENYYDTELEEIISYQREGKDACGLILKFKVLDDVEVENEFDLELSDGEVIIPFFAPAKLSYSEDSQNSRLTDNLIKIGLHEPVLNQLGIHEEVMEDNHKAFWDTEDVVELIDVLNGFFKGNVVNVDIADNQDGDESQVNKFSELVESDEEENGDENKEVIFDDGEE